MLATLPALAPLRRPPFVASGGGGGASPLLTGLMSYWKLEEETGDRFDALGVNQLQDIGGVNFTTGISGEGAAFSGSNQSLLHADTPSLQIGNADRTFAGWVWLDSVSGFPMVFAKTGGDIEYELFAPGGTSLTWRVETSGGLVSVDQSFPSLGTWVFFACWHDAANALIGLSVNNAAPVTAGTGGGGVVVSNGDFRLGARGNDSLFLDGRLDEFGEWSLVLDSDRLTALYNSGHGTTYPDFA